jgi:2',3'-cyclic-nucleotide 2'-phosphodiesterase (5'-nucleotidase family)
MKTTLENYRKEELEVELYFSQEFKSYGHWSIKCEVTFKGEKKTFTEVTTDSEFIDHMSDLKSNDASWDEIQDAYRDKVLDSLEESIIEWCENVLEKIEEND